MSDVNKAGGSARKAEDVTSVALPDNVKLAIEAVEANKGSELLVLDLREVASFTDYLMICNGRSERHVQALVDAIVDTLTEAKNKPLHTEGYQQATWVLVDFVDFLVNVFTPETRDFYQLERVWRDAPVMLGDPLDALDGNDGAEDGPPLPDEEDLSGAAEAADG